MAAKLLDDKTIRRSVSLRILLNLIICTSSVMWLRQHSLDNMNWNTSFLHKLTSGCNIFSSRQFNPSLSDHFKKTIISFIHYYYPLR